MLQSGFVLNNRYQLEQQLGDRSVRQTWLAQDLEAPQPVVVKLLAFGGPMQWEDLKLFEREAQVLQELNHPRIPEYRDYFSVDEQTLWFALVQEWIPGSSLAEMLQQGHQFSESEVKAIARQILEILTYLHDRRPLVLHRDIKPSNILWGEDECAYLIDFGAVQNRTIAAGGTFTVVGTYGYTPLEQFGGQTVPASDLYALGATAIHLLTGTAPADLPQRQMRIQWRDRANSSISQGFLDWIDRLSDPAIEQRFTSAKKAIAALDAIEKSSSGEETQLAQPLGTAFSLHKTSDRLAIEIPSPLELTSIYPLRNAIGTLGIALQQPAIGLVERFRNATPPIKALTILGSIGLTLTIWPFLPYLLFPASQILTRLILFLISLPFVLLPLFLPLLMLLAGIWAIRGGDFFERTYIYIDKKNFEIERRHFGSNAGESQRGETPQITEIAIGKYESRNQVRHGIVITAKAKWAIFSRAKTYVFGQQLGETELRNLAREIREWLQW